MNTNEGSNTRLKSMQYKKYALYMNLIEIVLAVAMDVIYLCMLVKTDFKGIASYLAHWRLAS